MKVRGRAATLLSLVPVLLLVGVALRQLVLHETHRISPWKGGGFGMFSTSEGGWTRHTHLFVREGDDEVEVDLPRALRDSERRLRALPSRERLEDFARRLADALRPDHPQLSGVRVELLHDFDYTADSDDGE